MREHGASRIYAKKLSPNDNSKNQVYLGGGFAALNVIPHSEIEIDQRQIRGSKQDRPKAKVRFFWVSEEGLTLAPDANLILYPDYPEVRMSGFLKGCRAAPSDIMTVRDAGRVLFLGTTPEGAVLGFAVREDHPAAKELIAREWPTLGIFLELPFSLTSAGDPRERLLEELRRISDRGWIPSQKLGADGIKHPYRAQNGGGYTLEAELGITPNGYAEPDFLGWEIKQYAVTDFRNYRPKTPVTLMTPEPNGGIYKDQSVTEFLRRFGYADKKGREGRINFGGVYKCGKDFHADTGLSMAIRGFDPSSGKIGDINGGIELLTREGEPAATWSFAAMMAHWNRKHAQAAYVPALADGPPPRYAYGSQILLCEQTDFIIFLKAFATGTIYYDPAVKLEIVDGIQKLKRRSQFRVRHADLRGLYGHSETVILPTGPIAGGGPVHP